VFAEQQSQHQASMTILILAGVTALSAAASCAAWFWRRREWPDFRQWWNAEGIVIFLVLWFVLAAVPLALGWIPYGPD
jgi:peptidoglycan biosynthesis protein MviN/MurJ (putative lipid II flippase)